jgi:hypothetical protein
LFAWLSGKVFVQPKDQNYLAAPDVANQFFIFSRGDLIGSAHANGGG